MCVCVKADFRILCVFSSAGKLFETFTETIVMLPTSCRTSANLLDKCSLQRSCLRQFRSLFFFFFSSGCLSPLFTQTVAQYSQFSMPQAIQCDLVMFAKYFPCYQDHCCCWKVASVYQRSISVEYTVQ